MILKARTSGPRDSTDRDQRKITEQEKSSAMPEAKEVSGMFKEVLEIKGKRAP